MTTHYEITITKPDGAKALVAYAARHSTRGLVDATRANAVSVIDWLGADDLGMETRSRYVVDLTDAEGEAAATVAFSGRTERTARTEGELEWVGA